MSRVVKVIALAVLGLASGTTAFGQSAAEPELSAGNVAVEVNAPSERYSSSPMALRGGSRLALISPQAWAPLAHHIAAAVQSVHHLLEDTVGEIPPLTLTMRLLDESSFQRLSGAPSWSQALFRRGEILLSFASLAPEDLELSLRAARHEYTHAVVHALSEGRCMGWLDEGLAQWAEGVPIDAPPEALTRWLSRNRPINFDLLQGGFTALHTDMVAAAYAQSVEAAQHLMVQQGMVAIRIFFDRLKAGYSQPEAFRRAFGLSEQQFEQNFFEYLEARYPTARIRALAAPERNHSMSR